MFNLFKKSPLLPEDTIAWLEDGFAWCLQCFGSDALQRTPLVQPSDEHFPGREKQPDAMANLILGHVQRHAGLAHWPLQAVDRHHAELPEQSPIAGLLTQTGTRLEIPYEPQQVAAPEVMIANYAHALAHHLGHLAPTPPPCDAEQWPHMAELLAVYLGFGIMLANTANPYRGGGCARCVSPAMERQGFLSEDETTYGLALFCALKGISEKEVIPHLKSSLRPFFKKALKEVRQRQNTFSQLQQIHSQPSLRYLAG